MKMRLQVKILIALIIFGFFCYSMDIATTSWGLANGYVECNPKAAVSFVTIGQPLTFLLVIAPWLTMISVVSLFYVLSVKGKLLGNNPYTIKCMTWILVIYCLTWVLFFPVMSLIMGTQNLVTFLTHPLTRGIP